MDILLGACVPITVSFHLLGKRFNVKLRPLPTRVALALNYPSYNNIRYPKDELVALILDTSIVKIEVDEREVSWRNLPLVIQNVLFNLIITLNGLTPEGLKYITDELQKLKEISLAEYEKRPPPYETKEWMLVAKAAFAAFRTGTAFSAPTLLDEPYLLLLAVNTIAQAEAEYYDRISATTARTETTIAYGAELPTFTSRLKEKGKEGVKEYMRKVFEQITGQNLPEPKKTSSGSSGSKRPPKK